MSRGRRRVLARLCGPALALLLAACASPLPPAPPDGLQLSGRIAVRVEGTPPQSFAAGFDLGGSARAGRMRLLSPLGTTLADVAWDAQGATLTQGADVRSYASLDALLLSLAGTPLPAQAVFDWLAGQPTVAQGWQPDVSAWSEGRVSARRNEPAPAAQLRLVFER